MNNLLRHTLSTQQLKRAAAVRGAAPMRAVGGAIPRSQLAKGLK